LILKERERRDLGRWEDMRDCFHADSQIRISWFRGNGADFVKGSIDMARCNVLAKRRLSPIRVVLAGRAPSPPCRRSSRFPSSSREAR
jgi:hypothetical protein